VAPVLLALAGLAVIADIDATGDFMTLVLRAIHVVGWPEAAMTRRAYPALPGRSSRG
jgi:hypothetical protein